MFWQIIVILFILFVMYSLSSINNQLKLITKHLGAQGKEMDVIAKVSDEEIEEELEDYTKR